MAVSLDNVSNKTSSNASTITLSHTTESGTDRLLVVVVDIKENVSVTSVTDGGVNLTNAGVANNSGNARAEIWYLKMPATGTDNVVVNITGNSDLVIGAATYAGVDQATPLRAFVSNTGSTITASVHAASATGEWVFDTMATRDASSITVGAGQTSQWNNGFSNFKCGSSTEPGAASVTMSWTLDVAKNWAIAAVPIKPAATSSAPVITSDGGGATASLNVAENTTAVTTVSAIDPESDPITYSISVGTDSALFNIDANSGALSFIAAPDYEVPGDVGANNVYEVEVTAADGNSGNDAQLISVTATDISGNESPVATGDAVSTDENTAVNIDVLANDTDPEGDTLTTRVITGPSNGSLVPNLLEVINETNVTNNSAIDKEGSWSRSATPTMRR